MEFRFIYICDFFIYIFSAALHLCCAQTVSSCSAVSRDCSLLTVHGLLLLCSMGSSLPSSVAAVHRPSYSMACGIFLDQGRNPWPLLWQVDS